MGVNALVSLIEKNNGCVKYEDLRSECEKSGMSKACFDVSLSRLKKHDMIEIKKTVVFK